MHFSDFVSWPSSSDYSLSLKFLKSSTQTVEKYTIFPAFYPEKIAAPTTYLLQTLIRFMNSAALLLVFL